MVYMCHNNKALSDQSWFIGNYKEEDDLIIMKKSIKKLVLRYTK